MSFPNAAARGLHAYHDGELGWWARRRFERRLQRSAELRRELESLRRLRELTAESEPLPTLAAGAVWEGIEGRLRAIDAASEAEGEGAPDPAPAWPAWIGWRPVGAAALAAAGAVALAIALQPGTFSGPAGRESMAIGSVRYLDVGNRSVVVHDRDDVTIIWVVGATDDA